MGAPNLRLSAVKILRWTARILGTLVVLLFLVFLIGEGAPHPSMLTASEKLLFIAHGTMLLGLTVAWKWPSVGGSLALLGYLFFGMVGGVRSLTMLPFAAGGLSGLLHLAGWWITSGSGRPPHAALKRPGVSLIVLGCGFAIIWVWLGSGAKTIAARNRKLPNLTGRWVGSSFVSDTLVQHMKVELDITVTPDRAFQGRIGDAAILKGRVESHLRGRLGYLQSLMGDPSYRMPLELAAPPLVTPRRSLPHADLYFDLRGEEIVGALHLTDLPEELRDLHVVLRRRNE